MSCHAGPNIVEDGLVLCLDAANPKSYPGSGTTWYDLSGNSNNGTLTNGPTYSADKNGSISFDGIDDYVTYKQTNDTCLNGSYFTIDCWCKIDATNTVNDNFIYAVDYNTYGYDQPSIAFGISPKIGRMITIIRNSSGSGDYTSYLSIPNNTWLHGVFVVDASISNIKGYLNSNLVYNKSVNFAFYPYISPPISKIHSFGNWQTGNSSDFVMGNISSMKIYNRALSATEIQQNFNAHRGRFGI